MIGRLKRAPLLLLIALVALALVMGLWAGLLRMGWVLPIPQPQMIAQHGALMISGVLGTLVSLERAVAVAALRGIKAAYLAPLLTGVGAVLLMTGVPGHGLIVAGSLGLVLILGVMIRQQPAPFTMIMGLGALSWLIGNVLWMAGHPVYEAVHWWMAFLILTIVGERLELSRVVRLSVYSQRLLLAAVALYAFGLLATFANLDFGIRAAGLGELALSIWLLRYDIARRTVRRTGLPRYIAVCLLGGYLWLGVSGIIGIVNGVLYAGFAYDALVHTLLIGFVFSMIFGHAPIIFPALTQRSIAFHSFFYGHLLLLHLSLLLRVISDLLMSAVGRQWGGMLNVTAVVLFVGGMIYGMIRGKSSRIDSQPGR